MKRPTFLTTLAILVHPGLLATGSAEDKVDFEKDVLPIFEDRCMECHRATYKTSSGRTKKPKGGLRMDDPKEIFKGDSEKGIVAGKSAESEIYKRIILDPEDDDIMPSKGDVLTKDQIAKIKAWIDAGAKTGSWKGTKFDAEGKKAKE